MLFSQSDKRCKGYFLFSVLFSTLTPNKFKVAGSIEIIWKKQELNLGPLSLRATLKSARLPQSLSLDIKMIFNRISQSFYWTFRGLSRQKKGCIGGRNIEKRKRSWFKTWCQQRLFNVESLLKSTLPLIILY